MKEGVINTRGGNQESNVCIQEGRYNVGSG